MTLFSAATMHTFTVCAADGRLLWHENFPRELDISTEAMAAETAAQQAIWLAGHARSSWGAQAAMLRLVLARGRGVDPVRLRRHAVAASLWLEVSAEPVPNPAADHSAYPDVVEWTSTDLARLLPSRQAFS